MKKLSIIMPVYNEEKTIREIINRVQNAKVGFNLKKEIIIVDDGSIDKTKEIIRKLQKEKKNKNMVFIAHKLNRGKGAALRTGFKYAKGDLLIIQDADLEYNPHDYNSLLTPILNNKSKVVYGSRFLLSNHTDMLYHYVGNKFLNLLTCHYVGNKFLTLLTNILFNSRLTDMETCYKVFTRKILNNINLKAKRFDFEPEITAKILKKRYKIVEVPISYKCRSWKEGKKITWKDGVKASYYLLKYRLTD